MDKFEFDMLPRFPDEVVQTRKKPVFSIGEGLHAYLKENGRLKDLRVTYHRLLDFFESVPLLDAEGVDTLWQTVAYSAREMKLLADDLTRTYVILKTDGEFSIMDHLYVDRIDFCTFGNSKPFRIRIVNSINDNQDYYYIKQADASRIYGLEIEHLMSPNRMNYFVSGDTLFEEHVIGIPGDVFTKNWLTSTKLKPVRVAKELVKFNERCFIRLLGDMRCYNFVVDVTPDFEEAQIRIRAMDFDQQSYSGRLNFYRPQFFKENNELVTFCLKQLDKRTAYQYQREEQALLYRRVLNSKDRIFPLLEHMSDDRISSNQKVEELGIALSEHHQNRKFRDCRTMGALLRESLEMLIANMENRKSGSEAFIID